MARMRRGSAVKKNLKFFIYGEHGTRKSSFCLDLLRLKKEDGSPMKVLYIDCETGSVDNYLEEFSEEHGVNLDNLLILYTTSYKEVDRYVKMAIEEEEFEDEDGEVMLDAEGNPFVADAIVIDGITVISDNVKFAAINVSEKRAKIKAISQEKTASERFVAEATAGLEFKDYDKIKMRGKMMLRDLITKTDKIVAVTSREKVKKTMQHVDGKMQLAPVGVVPDTWDGAEYEFFTVIRNYENEDTGEIEGKIMRKDRTLKFDANEVIDSPSPVLWQSVITGNKGKKSFVSGDNTEKDIANDEGLIAGQDLNELADEVSSKEEFNQLKKEIKKAGKMPDEKQVELKEMFKKAKLKPSDLAEKDIEFMKEVVEFIKSNLK